MPAWANPINSTGWPPPGSILAPLRPSSSSTASMNGFEVEVVLDEIKTHQRLQQPVLRSRTPDGVRQEVYALLLAHYAVRALMHRAACQAEVYPDRLSFTDTIFVL